MSGIFHGGRLDAAIANCGGERSDWLDLSTGINPQAYPVPSMDAELWQRLPDERHEQSLLQAAREYYQVPDRCAVVTANGTQAIIQLLPQLLDCASVSIVSPTYGEHFCCWNSVGREVREVSTLDEAVLNGGVVVVGNPNNPDCRRYEPEELLKVSAELTQVGGFLIVDEAFCDVEPELSIVPQLPGNAIVLRSFGKFFGLAGVRLGFAICSPVLASKLNAMIGPWAVSGPALEIGRVAMANSGWIAKSRSWVEQASSAQVELLEDCGMEVSGNAGLFIETKHLEADRIYEQLMRARILVRPFEHRSDHLRFGLCANQLSLDRLEHELKRVTGDVDA